MSNKVKKDEYLENKIGLIRAAVAGTLMGMQMWPDRGVYEATNVAMKLIEKDVRNIYKYAKRQSKRV